MAVFGNLADLPFPEVLTMIGRRAGYLLIVLSQTEKKFELHLNQGVLCGLYINNIKIIDVLQVRDSMLELINANNGDFEFVKCSSHDLTQTFNLPTDHILLSSAAAIDEIDAFRCYFPNEKTRFKQSGPLDLWLDDDLYTFWERSAILLENGSSAEDIAQQLGLNIDRVQLHLYKLRTAGKIEPIRAFEERSSLAQKPHEYLTHVVTPHVATTPPSFSTENDHTCANNEVNNNNHNNNGNNSIKNNHNNNGNSNGNKSFGLIKRMLKALTFGKY